MRQAQNTDRVPASVNKYLLPHERQVISVHEHPAVLIGPIFLVLVGLALAGWLSNAATHGNSTAILAIWAAWGVLLLWFGLKVWDWGVHHFVVTSQRLILVSGVILRRVNMVPLTKVTDMRFERSTWGRALGYGEFVVESAGQDQAMRNIRFIPYPEQLYLEVCGLIFKDRPDEDAPPVPSGPDLRAIADEFSQALTRSLDKRDGEFLQFLSSWLDQRDRREN